MATHEEIEKFLESMYLHFPTFRKLTEAETIIIADDWYNEFCAVELACLNGIHDFWLREGKYFPKPSEIWALVKEYEAEPETLQWPNLPYRVAKLQVLKDKAIGGEFDPDEWESLAKYCDAKDHIYMAEAIRKSAINYSMIMAEAAHV